MDDEKRKLFSKTKEILHSFSEKIKSHQYLKESSTDEKLPPIQISMYHKFLNKIIEIGIAAAQQDYSDPRNIEKLEGALQGFNLCEGMYPKGLQELLSDWRSKTEDAFVLEDKTYWKIRCCTAEVEWICGCVSAFLRSEGIADPMVPTARQWITTLEIKTKLLEEEIQHG